MQSTSSNPVILQGTLGTASLTARTNPAQPNHVKGVSPLSSATLNANSLEVLGNFSGIGAIGSCSGPLQQNGVCNPPDPIIAVGGSEAVEMVNLKINVWHIIRGNGASPGLPPGPLIESENLSTFWGCPACNSYSDPKVLFDASSQQFLASIIQVSTSQALIGASNSSDATFGWNLYTLPQRSYSGSPPSPGCPIGTTLFPDQPILGYSGDKVVLSDNDFCGNNLLGAHFWVLNKTEILSGVASLHIASFGPFANTESIHPVQSLSSGNTEYMVSTGGFEIGTTGSVVHFYSLTGVPPGNVTSTESNISLLSSINSPPAAPQKGTATTVWCSGGCNNGNDARVLDAKWSLGKLWYTLNEGCTPSGDSQNRTCVRLTELDTTRQTTIQDFDYSSAGQYYYFPALSIDTNQSIVVVYGFSNSTTYPSLAVTGQGYNDPSSTMRVPQVLVSGRNDSLSGRYGDYFGAATNPDIPSTVWVVGEYVGNVTGPCLTLGANGPCWSTRIAWVRAEDFSISANPTTLNVRVHQQGTSTITVASVDGFQGTVKLTMTLTGGLAGGCSLSPGIITLGTSGTSNLTCSFSSKGTEYVIVTATSGGIKHSVTVTFIVS